MPEITNPQESHPDDVILTPGGEGKIQADLGGEPGEPGEAGSRFGEEQEFRVPPDGGNVQLEAGVAHDEEGHDGIFILQARTGTLLGHAHSLPPTVAR